MTDTDPGPSGAAELYLEILSSTAELGRADAAARAFCEQRGVSEGELMRHFALRGAILMALDAFVVTPAWVLDSLDRHTGRRTYANLQLVSREAMMRPGRRGARGMFEQQEADRADARTAYLAWAKERAKKKR